MASKDTERRDEEEHDGAPADDEDTGAQVAPIVRLEEVAVTTGEEDEDVLLDLKSKLYRFDQEGKQWKERGTGTVKLLRHKSTERVRLVMRQSKTLKICANHLVLPTIKVQEHIGNEKSCVWHAADFADGELKEEMFCIRFASVENCKAFKDKIEEVAESQGKLEEKESKEASAAAELVEKLKVSDESKTEASEDKSKTEASEDKSKGEESKAESVEKPNEA